MAVNDDILDKLAWASFSEDAAIQRAAVLLKDHWTLVKDEGYRELKRLTKLTNPKRGKIKERRAAIAAEWTRQSNIRQEREALQRTIYHGRDKHSYLTRFGARNGVKAGGLRRMGGHLLILLGSPYSEGRFNGIAVKFPDGRVDKVEFPQGRYGSYSWKTVEKMLVEIPQLIVGDERLARATLEGGAVVHNLPELRTTITYPDGEEIIVKWPVERARYAPKRPDDVLDRVAH